MHSTLKVLRITAHVLLFLLAAVVFLRGMFIGLQVSPNDGTLMWTAAAAIAGLNVLWMLRSEQR